MFVQTPVNYYFYLIFPGVQPPFQCLDWSGLASPMRNGYESRPPARYSPLYYCSVTHDKWARRVAFARDEARARARCHLPLALAIIQSSPPGFKAPRVRWKIVSVCRVWYEAQRVFVFACALRVILPFQFSFPSARTGAVKACSLIWSAQSAICAWSSRQWVWQNEMFQSRFLSQAPCVVSCEWSVICVETRRHEHEWIYVGA